MLFELKYILGDSLYYAAMQHYFSKWKLKHVNENRFINSFEEYVDQDLNWFLILASHYKKTGLCNFKF